MTLRYTGHPIADVGVATVCAFCDKTDPETINDTDLTRIAEFLNREYFSGKLTSYISAIFPNSLPHQAIISPKNSQKFAERFRSDVLLRFQKPPANGESQLNCTFCGDPTATLFYRQHVPLITGEGVLNFFPAARGGMPLCGRCLLAVQMFPLGCRRSEGRALAVHCPDDPSLTYDFARRFLLDNRKLLSLAQKAGEKYEDAKAPRTLVVSTLTEIMRMRASSLDMQAAGLEPSITVYHLTNYGQEPDVNVFNLPSEVVSFVTKAARAGTSGDIWNRIVARAWEAPAPSRESASKTRKSANSQGTKATPQPGKNRNFLYEDLFQLPDDTARFVRTYFLRRAWRFGRKKNDPRSEYSAAHELALVSWALTHLFLREVLGMDKVRIDAIREFADRLASHISGENDRRLFRNLCMAENYFGFRNRLLRASAERVRKGNPPLTSFDEFVLVFEAPDERQRTDRRLGIDLVLIRLIEKLHSDGWFQKQPDAVKDLEEAADESNDAASVGTVATAVSR